MEDGWSALTSDGERLRALGKAFVIHLGLVMVEDKEDVYLLAVLFRFAAC